MGLETWRAGRGGGGAPLSGPRSMGAGGPLHRSRSPPPAWLPPWAARGTHGITCPVNSPLQNRGATTAITSSACHSDRHSDWMSAGDADMPGASESGACVIPRYRTHTCAQLLPSAGGPPAVRAPAAAPSLSSVSVSGVGGGGDGPACHRAPGGGWGSGGSFLFRRSPGVKQPRPPRLDRGGRRCCVPCRETAAHCR